MGKKVVMFDEIGIAQTRVPIFGNADALGVSNFLREAFDNQAYPLQGTVISYNPQTHSASVSVRGETYPWNCVFADELLSYSFGYSETHPPREGDLVLVVRKGPFSSGGIVIGRIPFPWDFTATGDPYKDPDNYHRRLFTQLTDTEDRKIPCFEEPLVDKNDSSTHLATNFRPTDVYPGEFARINQHNCGIKGGLFSATLLGGGANLRLSALNNAARLSCEEYIRNTLHGSFREFHNGRYLSSERNYALYQEERLGGDAPKANVWTDDSEAPVGGENQTMRPRMRDLTGFFGHLSSKFCFRPDPDEGSDPRVQGGKVPKEAGVSRETVDPSGQYRLSSAGMIAIERTGRIPVPVRTSYHFERGHEIEEELEKLSLKPFEHSTEDPSYRQLELFDRQAYDLKNQYSRVDGLGTESADYETPQEEDMSPLRDKYDAKFTGSETVKLEQFDKRRAGLFIGEDGSVIVRDAWGSEIVMMGGNIQLSCAGNVMLLPGKTQLTIAGDDIVQKAQNSVDIHASEHDVRLSAAKNMEILGGADEKQHQGGVIIESRGKSIGPWDGSGDEAGESVPVNGITLRTKNQGVVIDGIRVNVRSRKDTRILSGDKEMDGIVSIGAKQVRGRAKTIIFASERAAMAVNGRNFSAVADSIEVYADSGLNVVKGNEYPVPAGWEKARYNVAAYLLPKLEEATHELSVEKDASAGFDAEKLEKMVFSFRTSEQCGTDVSWTIGGPKGFRMYEPAWVQVMKVYETLSKFGVNAAAYEEKAEWENGKPFPGKAAEESAEYVQLKGLEPPFNLTKEGFNKRRDEVKDKTEIETVKLKGGYMVRSSK